MPLTIEGREHDLGGGFTVRRLLPHAQCRSVGPFVFLDHIGPSEVPAEHPLAVRPHPHIGLATVTFLWEGAIMHRDSLGFAQEIRPGDVNWMTAGRGIVHSERTPGHLLGKPHRMHGLQTWVALPREHEETSPDFAHHPAATLPVVELPGVCLRIVAGDAFGETSPVKVLARTLYVSIELQGEASLVIPAEHAERALYPVEGELTLDGEPLAPGRLVVLEPGSEPLLRAGCDATVMLLGGEPLDGRRHVWWNFVSSSRERIEQAKADWEADRMGQVAGEHERIPLPAR
ncbi:pirin family protein [Arenimonas sp.]|uniref:pirin family protein n=1 Tax=Arenimonas sp. TaxID=1872635 RepID=UPI0025E44BB2|nr:pirin family protein [Arenimonas sp.]